MATATLTVKVDPAGVRAFLTGATGPVWRDVQRRGNRVLNAARAGCPVDEGRLRASLTMEMLLVDGVPVARVGSNLPYLVFVHEGTGVYAGRGYIYPRNGRFLRWPIKNGSGVGPRRYAGGATAGYAFARKVKGQPGNPFLLKALDAAR